MLPRGGRAHSAARRAHQEAELHQVRFVDVLNGHGILAGCRREGVQPDRAAAEFVHHRAKDGAIHLVQPQLVHALHGNRLPCHIEADDAAAAHLRVVADALEHPVCDSRRTAASARDFHDACVLRVNLQNRRASADDLRQFLRLVHFQPEENAEAVAQRGGQLTCAGCRANEREFRHGDANRPRGRAFANHDVDGKVLHRGVQHLFHRAGEAVNFVDEQHVPLIEVRQN